MAKYYGKNNPINRSKVDTPYSFPGYKCMSMKHMPKGSGKMSSAHGTGKSSATKGMINASGRIGAGKKGFGHNISKGPKKIS
jgi:hypothetical protein